MNLMQEQIVEKVSWVASERECLGRATMRRLSSSASRARCKRPLKEKMETKQSLVSRRRSEKGPPSEEGAHWTRPLVILTWNTIRNVIQLMEYRHMMQIECYL